MLSIPNLLVILQKVELFNPFVIVSAISEILILGVGIERRCWMQE